MPQNSEPSEAEDEAKESEKKEDRRVRRTKKLMTQGLFRLMQRKQVKDISVRELADECDINRGTFYLYYKDIYDMLEQVENNMFGELDKLLQEQESHIEAHDSYPVLRAMFSYVEKNRDLCRVLLSSNGDIGFLERIDRLLREKCRNEWVSLHQGFSEEGFEIGYSFVIFGCIGMLRTWINSEHPEPVETMTKIADLLLHKGALSLIDQEGEESSLKLRPSVI